MKVQPSYAENIIVFTLFKGVGRWFVSNKELWYLDLRKLIKAFEDIGYFIPNPDDFSDRLDIDVVNQNNVEDFLIGIGEYEVQQSELTSLLLEKSTAKVSGLAPSLFVDFDLKAVYSFYPEPASFEKHIPDDWEGYYRNILPFIPDEHKYWIEGNKNLLAKEREK